MVKSAHTTPMSAKTATRAGMLRLDRKPRRVTESPGKVMSPPLQRTMARSISAIDSTRSTVPKMVNQSGRRVEMRNTMLAPQPMSPAPVIRASRGRSASGVVA